MINLNDVTKESTKKHNPTWAQSPDNPYRIFKIGGSRFGKTNLICNLISHQTDIDKFFYMQKIHMKQNITY